MTKLSYITLFILTLSACSHSHDHEESSHNEQMPESNSVHLTKKQMDLMGIELGEEEYVNLSSTVKSNGELELPPQNKASLSAIMAGRVVKIYVTEGQKVRKGQILASLEHPQFIELQEQYLKCMSETQLAQNQQQRTENLFKDHAVSERELQEAEAKYKSSNAQLRALKEKLEMLHLDVKQIEDNNFAKTVPILSPINGYVRLVEVNIGKYIEPQQEMFEIVDNDHIHIDLRVYEKDINKVRVGQKVLFSLSNTPEQIFEGKVFALGKAFEESPRAMVVHAEIDNKDQILLPGMYVQALIVTDNQKVKALPDDAIVRDEGLSYIFVQRPHEHGNDSSHQHNEMEFIKIEVKVGAKDLGYTQVSPIYDLPDHVQIVTKGAFYLLAEMNKGEGGHGHSH